VITENNLLTRIYFNIFPEKFVNYHVYRQKLFVRKLASRIKPHQKLIDIGAGSCQYRNYFEAPKYFSQDVVDNDDSTIDYISGLDPIPVEADSFDFVLCTQVLEHLKEPNSAFSEFYRILVPGGELHLTTHQSFEEHMAPNDFFRFTRYGLKYLAEINGFTVIEISPQGGRGIALAKEIQVLVPRLCRNRVIELIYYFLFSVPLFFVMVILYWVDKLDKEKTLTLNYECIFRKLG